MAYSTLTAVWVSLGLGIVTIRYLKREPMTIDGMLPFWLLLALALCFWLWEKFGGGKSAMVWSDRSFALAWSYLMGYKQLALGQSVADALIFAGISFVVIYGVLALIRPLRRRLYWGSSKPNAAEATDGARKA